MSLSLRPTREDHIVEALFQKRKVKMTDTRHQSLPCVADVAKIHGLMEFSF